MAFIKCIKGSARKADLFETVVAEMENYFPNVASNPTQDNSANGTDGYVFKVTSKDGTRSGYVQLKRANAPTNRTNLFIYVNLAEDYVPGNPGSNGTFTEKYVSTANTNYCIILAHGSTTVDTIYNYYISIFDDGVAVLCSPEGFVSAYDGGFFAGYPNPESLLISNSNSNSLMKFPLLSSDNNTPGSGAYLMRGFDGTKGKIATFVAMTTISSNPQVDGTFLLVPNTIADSNYYVGEVQGVYTLNNSNIARGDIINMGSEQYFIYTSIASYCPLPNTMSAFRIG